MNNVIEKIEDMGTETGAKLMVKATGTVNKICGSRKLRRVLTLTLTAAVAVGCMAIAVSAAGDGGADSMFTEIETQIKEWVGRIGGLVIIFGGVTAGIGIANQDDAGRNRGLMTCAGGAILAAIVAIV